MYGYRSKYNGPLKWGFGILRFLTLFAIVLLLINPKFKSETYTIEKPRLPVLVDNSASVVALGQSEGVLQFVSELRANEALNEKFDVSYYSFGSNFKEVDSLSFSDKNTNLSKALETTQELYKNDVAPTLLITDGNQTLGTDYEFAVATFKNTIYPVMLGDSTTYTDLKVQQLNANRYAFLKNKFPVEVILVYSGTGSVNSQFVVKQGAAVVYRSNVSFSETNTTQTLNFTLPASAVGLQRYTAQVLPLEDEKNTTNNVKQFAVEVIDQATNVLVVSKIIHPDLGALKKSITTNEQRTVTFKKPSEAVSLLNDHQLIILYQPDRSFSGVFSEIDKLKKNSFVIAGLETDWNFLNNVQNYYKKEVTTQTEEVSARISPNYSTFAVENIGFENFPPLQTLFGGLSITVPHDILLDQTIDGFASENALLATMELDGSRNAIWDGEGLWKWRAQSYLASNSFESFDEFIAKMIQYLASNKRRSRLEVSNETFYYSNNPIRISAQYFDKNFVFDSRVSLQIIAINQDTEARSVFPLLLKNNFYEVDLNSLSPGTYKYTVSVQDEAVSRSGSFTILDFNVEQQFLNANVSKLQRVATNSGGEAYFITEASKVLNDLLENDRYRQVQKSEQKVVPLVDWKFLLGFIILTLTLEWFIRKYNGLI